MAAVSTARDEGLELSVRGGGHGVAGRALTDGGLTIDLSRMKGIHVDPQNNTVRAQPGVNWKELNRETQVYGLAVTGGVISTTGISGLTLGGGLGWIMARDGLALDNLLSADVVTAEAGSCAPARTRTPTCSGRCAAAAATSGSSLPSNTGSVRLVRRSTAASSHTRSRRHARSCSSIAS